MDSLLYLTSDGRDFKWMVNILFYVPSRTPRYIIAVERLTVVQSVFAWEHKLL